MLDHARDRPPADGAEGLRPLREHDAIERGAIEPLRGVSGPFEGADLARELALREVGIRRVGVLLREPLGLVLELLDRGLGRSLASRRRDLPVQLLADLL